MSPKLLTCYVIAIQNINSRGIYTISMVLFYHKKAIKYKFIFSFEIYLNISYNKKCLNNYPKNMVYGPEKLNDHLNDQLSETPKLSAAIKMIKAESGEIINSVHELMSSHFLNKLKNNPDMVKKILSIINWLNMQDMPYELKQLKNYLNQLITEEIWDNSNNSKPQK